MGGDFDDWNACHGSISSVLLGARRAAPPFPFHTHERSAQSLRTRFGPGWRQLIMTLVPTDSPR